MVNPERVKSSLRDIILKRTGGFVTSMREDFYRTLEIHYSLRYFYLLLLLTVLPDYILYPLVEACVILICDIYVTRDRFIRYVVGRCVWYYFLECEIYLPLWLAFGVYGTYMVPGSKSYKSSRGAERLEFFLQPFYYLLFLPAALLCYVDYSYGVVAAHILLFYNAPDNPVKYQTVIPVGHSYLFSPFDWI